MLHGYPMLEARLNATSAGIAPFETGMKPELHLMRVLGWFQRAGITEPGIPTFAGDVHAPLSSEMRNALIELFEMRWGEVQSEVFLETVDRSGISLRLMAQNVHRAKWTMVYHLGRQIPLFDILEIQA